MKRYLWLTFAAAALIWPQTVKAQVFSQFKVAPIQPLREEGAVQLRDGKLYVSLQQAIELALQNNLDLEIQRENLKIARTDSLRAAAGGQLRGVGLAVREGPTGLGSPVTAAAGRVGGSDAPALDRLTGPGTQTDLSILGSLPLSTGPSLVNRDWIWRSSYDFNHSSTPQLTPFFAGTDSINLNRNSVSSGIEQGFSTGTKVNLGIDLARTRSNSPLLSYNPYSQSSIGFSITQPLLRGFGRRVNNRYIRIAKNNQTVSQYVFEQQVIATVTAVARLYWDLVSLREDVTVRQEAVNSANRLLRDTRDSLEAGRSAAIDVTRAEAEVARRRRDLQVAESLVRQQEIVLADYITRGRQEPYGVIPTDQPGITPLDIASDLNAATEKALHARPDLAQARLQLDNSGISLTGSRNAVLPSVDVVASVANNGLGGSANVVPPLGNGIPRAIDPQFIGGPGSALNQVFARNYPDYGVGVQVTIPIRNRIAQADVQRDQHSVRQSEIRLRQLEKMVRVEIANARVALEQAQSSFESAVSERRLQQQALDAEVEKLAVGATAQAQVIQLQRDLAQARSAEVNAMNSYMKAKLALERAAGVLLAAHRVDVQQVQ
ncbi:MAG: TolC family protein [Acidobacteria bacterium]|nr:TolC family protein [Acidobacteriota bacterium]